MQAKYRVLVINPKSTSTIISVFQNEFCLFQQTITHPSSFKTQVAVLDEEIALRKEAILTLLNQAGINLSKLDAVGSNGGLLRPIEGGTYIINEDMLIDLRNNYNGKHVSNLGAIIAHEIAAGLNIVAYVIDPPVVDELGQLARFSGLPSIERKSIFHALNQKYAARQAAREMDKMYEDTNLLVAHIGHGITIGAHEGGKVIDVNNGLHGDGPFSLERTGTIPSEGLIKLCFSGQYTEDEVIKKITFEGGLKAYLEIEEISEVDQLILKGNNYAKEIVEAMAYQISKELGSMATVFGGNVDGVVLTGELSKSTLLTELIISRVNWIADVFIYPGEFDIQALNEGVLRVLRKEEEPKEYIIELIS